MIGTSSFPSPHKTTHYTGGSDALTPSDISALALSGGTLSGNLAMNGTANTAPNQTAASGSSVMTRDLTDARLNNLLIAAPRRIWISSFSGWLTSTSGGTVSQGIYLRCGSGSTQWQYAAARSYQLGEISPNSAGDTVTFSKATLLGVVYQTPGANYRNSTDQIFLGATAAWTGASGSALAYPATKGVGWRIQDETIYATMVNNTPTYSEPGSNALILSSGGGTRQNVWLVIVGDGVGGFIWYVNGASIASTSSGPTGATATGEAYFTFSSVCDVNGQANLNSISAILFDQSP